MRQMALALLSLLFLHTATTSNLTARAAAGAADAGADLIAATCNRTLYYDVCVSSLGSRPRSRGADLRGLAAISLDVGLAHAKATVSFARALAKRRSLASDAYASGCLSDCLEEYGEAVDSLRASAGALHRDAYATVNELVSGAMTNSDACESGFAERPGLQSPLTERNDYFFKLCSNSIAITNLLGQSRLID